MNKKFYDIKKCDGITSIYFVVKSKDISHNKRFEINADDFLSMNNVSIDYTTNKYVFYAKDIELYKTEKFVLELSIKDEPNNFRKVIPIPTRQFFKTGYDEFINQLKNDNPNCELMILQFYKYGK
jgi:hypothetical protein